MEIARELVIQSTIEYSSIFAAKKWLQNILSKKFCILWVKGLKVMYKVFLII